MVDYNYNFEILKNVKMFISSIDDTVIKRYETEDRANDAIKVNYVYGPKSKTFADINGKTDTVKLPIVAVTLLGMSRDQDRVKNKIDDIIYPNADGSFVNMKATPFNLTVQLNILCKHPEDMDQIIQNFAVYANPYIVYSLKEPKSGRELRVEALWDGNIAVTYPDQLPATTKYEIVGTTTFTIKTWLYRTKVAPVTPICFLNTDVIATNNFYCDYATLTANTRENQTDHYRLSGKPSLKYIHPYYIREETSPTITVQGDGFLNTYSLFVSGNDTVYPEKTAYMPLSAFGDNTVYYGVNVPYFQIDSARQITFELPAPSGFGFIDVFAVTPCGMGQLTVDANRCGRVKNPYSTDSPSYSSWCISQFPFLNGLIVTNDLNNMEEIDCSSQIIYDEETIAASDANSSLDSCNTITIRTVTHQHLSGDIAGAVYWNDTYNAFSAQSANNISVYNLVNSTSGTWVGDYFGIASYGFTITRDVYEVVLSKYYTNGITITYNRDISGLLSNKTSSDGKVIYYNRSSVGVLTSTTYL